MDLENQSRAKINLRFEGSKSPPVSVDTLKIKLSKQKKQAATLKNSRKISRDENPNIILDN